MVVYNQGNNICLAINIVYAYLLNFIDKYKDRFNKQQNRGLYNLKLYFEISLPLGKHTTSKLEFFKKIDDPTYNNQIDFFEKDFDYIEEMKIEAENIRRNIKKYEIEKIDENKFFIEPENTYKKYELVKYYDKAYKTCLLLNKSFDDEMKKEFEDIINKTKNAFYMAYRMCRKLKDYEKVYPYKGDKDMWLKDQKMTTIIKSAKRFKKIREENFKRRK